MKAAGAGDRTTDPPVSGWPLYMLSTAAPTASYQQTSTHLDEPVNAVPLLHIFTLSGRSTTFVFVLIWTRTTNVAAWHENIDFQLFLQNEEEPYVWSFI